jgi:hypothetical protein
MAEESGQDSTSKQDALIVTADGSNPNESEETVDTRPSEERDSPSSEEEEPNEFDQLIGLMLELDPNKYAAPWTDIELQKMREIITAGRGKFPKKVLPYIGLFRKFLFANAQLIAMAALAHQTAIQRSNKEEQLIKPATFKEMGAVEAARARGE